MNTTIPIRPSIYTQEDIKIARRVGIRAQIQYQNKIACKMCIYRFIGLIILFGLIAVIGYIISRYVKL